MHMENHYQRIINYIVSSGKRIREKAGKMEDIGVTKQFLTEEDIAIERGLKEIIAAFGQGHQIFGEEEHTSFKTAENLWVIDPISGTLSFLRGLPTYSIVLSHVHKGEVQFAAIYDPSFDELFTAYKGKGAFLNGESIHANENPDPFPITGFNFYPPIWTKDPRTKEFIMKSYGVIDLYRNGASCGLNYCYTACGRHDGVVTLGKDVYVEFAGGLIIREAGGLFTNIKGEEKINSDDRIFIGGNSEVYKKLKGILDVTFS